MGKVALITSNYRRHKHLASVISASHDICGIVVESKPVQDPASRSGINEVVKEYFLERDRLEDYYFSNCDFPVSADRLYQVTWGESNNKPVYEWLKQKSPDYIVLFGSSIIKDPLLSEYRWRIINLHLGLSPYYRGSSTNFWPLVNGEPECVGVTIHHAVLAVDAGRILAQGRPDISVEDLSHDFGCKSVIKGAQLMLKVLELLENNHMRGVEQPAWGRLYKRNDFTVEAFLQMKKKFDKGMVKNYLQNKEKRDTCFPIIEVNENV